jgi:hypothetical protein
LIEGDGSIITPPSLRDSKGRLIAAYVEICFDIKDYYLALIIQSLIGGFIRFRKSNKNSSNSTSENELGGHCILVIKSKLAL